MIRFAAHLVGLALLWTNAAAAACLTAPAADPAFAESAAGATRADGFGRVVAPVTVNGQGPFRFIVDTGANRSALSQQLAERLGLVSTAVGEVHSVTGVAPAPLVDVQTLQYGALAMGNAGMPVLSGAVLAGEHGLLGVDGMRGRRLHMDFERNCIEISPARQARRLRGWTAIRGQLRFGHLVVVPGEISGVRAHVLIDTGADSTLANVALREALNARERRRSSPIDYFVAYTAGRPVVLDNRILLPRLDIGELEVRSVSAFVGDFHIFDLWGLREEPTLLVGMDVLAQMRGLAIDYERAMVYVRLREEPLRMQVNVSPEPVPRVR